MNEVGVPLTKDRKLLVVVENLDKLIGEFDELALRLRNFNDRMTGAEPEEEKGDQPTSSDILIERLMHQISILSDISDGIDCQMSRIEGIA